MIVFLELWTVWDHKLQVQLAAHNTEFIVLFKQLNQFQIIY